MDLYYISLYSCVSWLYGTGKPHGVTVSSEVADVAPSEETVSGERLSTQIIGAINFLTLKLQVLKVPCLTSENNPLYCH